MAKFIEVMERYPPARTPKKRLLNVDTIREVKEDTRNQGAYISMRNEELYVEESYEDVKAMLMYDPAVADIFIKGKELS